MKVFIDCTELDGWEPRAAWDDFSLGSKHGSAFEKAANYGKKGQQEEVSRITTLFSSGDLTILKTSKKYCAGWNRISMRVHMSVDEQILQAIMKDPGGHFSAPKDVLLSKELSVDQKKAVLESWQVDEQELAKATEENMGVSDNNLLDEVSAALSSLNGNKA